MVDIVRIVTPARANCKNCAHCRPESLPDCHPKPGQIFKIVCDRTAVSNVLNKALMDDAADQLVKLLQQT